MSMEWTYWCTVRVLDWMMGLKRAVRNEHDG
jgi:hypothetical protein